MASKSLTVFGTYRDRTHVEEGVDKLVKARFRPVDISVLVPENAGTKETGHEKHTKTPEGSLGLLVGAGAASIPGLGPFLAAGPIKSAITGGLTGALTGMGAPEYDAKRYEALIKKGRALLCVQCDNSDWVKRAKNNLEQSGAEDISSTAESGTEYAAAEKPKTRTGGTY